MKASQLNMLKKTSKAYGGELLKTRKGRAHGRPLDTKNSMHLVLRSSKAKGDLSFLRKGNDRKVRQIVQKFSIRYGVQILSLANVGNHLHFQIKLGNRFGYKPFIRAITAAIAMAVTGVSRWKKVEGKFWDYRSFTRVIMGFKAFLTLRDYIQVNKIEGFGCSRNQARFLIEWERHRPHRSTA